MFNFYLLLDALAVVPTLWAQQVLVRTIVYCNMTKLMDESNLLYQ